ncbi:MAG TPA: DNA polymerase III subunit beta, partial [Actinomycetota bacterium]|nr:DNA polymerase III subunit beta [Actinomycetota bacterium]
DETRPVLTGVLFEGDGSELRIVATDSYRLALRRLELSGAEGVKVLVPVRAVTEVARLASSGDVRVTVGPAQVGFETGSVTVWSRLIEGEFPEYRKVIPESPPFHLQLDRVAFQDVLKRVSVLAHDATPVFMELEPDRVRLQCQAQGIGEFVEEAEASYEGDQVRLALNPTYLDVGVSAVPDERLMVDLTDPLKPIVVRGESDGFIYLLVPIRVG